MLVDAELARIAYSQRGSQARRGDANGLSGNVRRPRARCRRFWGSSGPLRAGASASANTSRRWRDEFVAAGCDLLTGQGDAAAAALENQRMVEELAERESIIGVIMVANRLS